MEMPVLPASSPPPDWERLLNTVSPSRLQCWTQCRLKFYFRYVAKIEKPPSPALHVGKVAHAVLQAWNWARWRGLPTDKLKAVFLEHWDEHRETKIDWEGQEEQERTSTWALLQTFFAQTSIKDRPEAVEVSVEAQLPGSIQLVGIIDLVRAGGRIVDFKTTSKTPSDAMSEHQHEIQLCCYALLYRDATGKKESGMELHYLVRLKTPKLALIGLPPMNERQEARLHRIIHSYREGLQRRDFVPSSGFGCAGCEYFAECRRWDGKESHG